MSEPTWKERIENGEREQAPPNVNHYCRNCREHWTEPAPGYAEHLNCPVCHSTSVEFGKAT